MMKLNPEEKRRYEAKMDELMEVLNATSETDRKYADEMIDLAFHCMEKALQAVGFNSIELSVRNTGSRSYYICITDDAAYNDVSNTKDIVSGLDIDAVALAGVMEEQRVIGVWRVKEEEDEV